MFLGELEQEQNGFEFGRGFIVCVSCRLCHQWGFEDLEESVCEYLMSTLHVGNMCAILDTALAFGLTSLTQTCCVFGDQQAVTLLEHPTFLNLSPVRVKLERVFIFSVLSFLSLVVGWGYRTDFKRLILCPGRKDI